MSEPIYDENPSARTILIATIAASFANAEYGEVGHPLTPRRARWYVLDAQMLVEMTTFEENSHKLSAETLARAREASDGQSVKQYHANAHAVHHALDPDERWDAAARKLLDEKFVRDDTDDHVFAEVDDEQSSHEDEEEPTNA